MQLPPYQYVPFDGSRNEIRVLDLLPGQLADPLEVAISTVTLRENSTTPYEALSYPWGSKDDPLFPIILRSGFGFGQLVIRKNLYTILKSLRSPVGSRILWTDAICIDQKNKEEKAEQVLKMHQVYSLAARVVIWLDSGSLNTHALVEEAFDILSGIREGLDLDWKTGSIRPRSTVTDGLACLERRLNMTKSRWDAVSQLMNVEWFNRLWTVQEARLASPSSICFCGTKTILWQDLMDSLLILRLHPCPTTVRDRARYLTNIFNPATQWSLLKLCELTSRQGCEDRRDHVYALLGMLPAEQAWLPLRVDYSLTLNEVFIKLAETFIAGNWLKFLSLCRPVAAEQRPRPSWAPNPLLPRDAEEFYLPGCGVPTRGETIVTDGKVLRAAAVECGVVSAIIASFGTSMGMGEVISGIIRVLSDEAFTDNYVSGCSVIEALCGTILAKDYSTLIEPPDPQIPSLPSSIDILRTVWQYRHMEERNIVISRQLQQMPDASSFLLGFAHVCKGRALVRTSNGYLGLAPSLVETGDMIYNILGHQIPLLLRYAGETKFHIVGDCFAYGLMNAEALLGPFPPSVEKIVHPSGDRTKRRTYRDKATGNVTLVDPRVISQGIFHGFDEGGVPHLVTREDLKAIGTNVQVKHIVWRYRYHDYIYIPQLIRLSKRRTWVTSSLNTSIIFGGERSRGMKVRWTFTMIALIVSTQSRFRCYKALRFVLAAQPSLL
ncbi:Heterokaryon incompatibility protein [Paramyrothecium foliicola]|nr:Heterokaryon incompatibility protein [Paramyrothecium foliicola]